jgi:hypothetical protein
MGRGRGLSPSQMRDIWEATGCTDSQCLDR